MNWAIAIVVAVCVVYTLAGAVIARRADSRFSGRDSSIDEWRRAFPGVADSKCDEFLAAFVDAFSLRRADAAKFRPDDEVLAIYRAKYPPRWSMGDCMEIENLSIELDRRYGLDLLPMFRESLTLGDIFRRIQRGEPGVGAASR